MGTTYRVKSSVHHRSYHYEYEKDHGDSAADHQHYISDVGIVLAFSLSEMSQAEMNYLLGHYLIHFCLLNFNPFPHIDAF